MKIERINENQIRCTLTKADLEEHEVLLNELAFGGENAKELFRDMMAQASDELGFEAEDTPLMIEAVPVSSEQIVLIVTKMDNPEELDDKFSKYMKPLGDLASLVDNTENPSDSSDEAKPEEKTDGFTSISQILQEARKMAARRMSEQKDTTDGPAKDTQTKEPEPEIETHRIYRFPSLVQIMDVCQKISPLYDGVNSLYKDTEENFYYLVLACKPHSSEEFTSIGNVLSEFGLQIPYTYGAHAYFEEHFSKISEDNAINTLASL